MALSLIRIAGDCVPDQLRIDAPLTIGRDPGCDLRLRDDRASRIHARVEADGRDWRLVDDGSANGCLADGERVEAVSLRDGRRERLEVEAETIDGAQREELLRDVAARLSVSVESRLRDVYREVEGTSVESLEHVLETRVLGARFHGWERTRSAERDGVFWAEVRIDRRRLIDASLVELNELADQVDARLGGARGSAISTLLTLQATATDRDRVSNLVAVVDALDPDFDRARWDRHEPLISQPPEDLLSFGHEVVLAMDGAGDRSLCCGHRSCRPSRAVPRHQRRPDASQGLSGDGGGHW